MDDSTDFNISVQEGSVGSRRRIARAPQKIHLCKEKKYTDKDPLLINYVRPCNHNGKSYMCAKIKNSDVKVIRKIFFDIPDKITQDVKLCHMLGVCTVARKRPVRNVPRNRSLNITYYLKTKEKKAYRVCQKMFLAVFGILKKRINNVAQIIYQGKSPKENRGGDRISHKSEAKKVKIREFIGKLHGRESHYNRSKSRRIYLPANLSIRKLHKQYNLECGNDCKSSLTMFQKIFCSEYNIGFSSPAADACSLCTRLKYRIKHEKDSKRKSDLMIELRIHKKRASAFYKLAKSKPPKSLTFCFDLQQVQPLPRTPISDAFYSHQISFYVFCCVGMNSLNPTFYTWSEDEAGRGSEEISSALLSHLTSLNFENIEVIRLFCDGCGGQNKNSHVIHALYYWLKAKSPPGIQQIEIVYPVRGHSFLPADRAFGRVEKCLRKNPTIITKQQYIEIYSEHGTVKNLGDGQWKLYNVKRFQAYLKKIEGISDLKKIKLIKKKNKDNITVKVQCHQNFYYVALNETPHSIVKRGQTDSRMELQEVEARRSVPDKKKKTLKHLMEQQFGNEWEQDERLEWYKQILSHTTREDDESEDETIEECDCLEEDIGLHI